MIVVSCPDCGKHLLWHLAHEHRCDKQPQKSSPVKKPTTAPVAKTEPSKSSSPSSRRTVRPPEPVRPPVRPLDTPLDMAWDVYGLVDPSNDQVFYVGCSSNLQNRMSNHFSDPASAAYNQCRAIIERGDKVGHRLFASGIPKKDARILEASLILSTPALTNGKPTRVGFDKKAYQRELMRKRRAADRAARQKAPE